MLKSARINGQLIGFTSVPVDENIVESEFENESLELLLHLKIGVLTLLPREDVKRLYRPAVHFVSSQYVIVFQANECRVIGKSCEYAPNMRVMVVALERGMYVQDKLRRP